MRWCRDEHELSGKTISTYLSYIRRALGPHPAAASLLTVGGREREVMLLSAGVPYVEDGEDKVYACSRPAALTAAQIDPDGRATRRAIDALQKQTTRRTRVRFAT